MLSFNRPRAKSTQELFRKKLQKKLGKSRTIVGNKSVWGKSEWKLKYGGEIILGNLSIQLQVAYVLKNDWSGVIGVGGGQEWEQWRAT